MMSSLNNISLSTPSPLAPQPPEMERRLVSSLRMRDQQALSTLYNMYAASLKGIILRIVIHEETAEDLLQETFVKIWNSIDKYDDSKGRLFTWMARLAKNMAIDQLRRKSHINSNKHVDIEEKVADIDHRLSYKINTDLIGIRTLTKTMNPMQRLLLNMVYFEGYTHNEIAEELNLPLGTVKSKIRFALLQLRKMF
ncbi:MAG: sigma-70 family RNA polymerase sigma factor [Pedobacter sp.]